MVFLPPLLERLHRDAPGARVETRSTPQEEIEAALAGGELDLAVGFLPGLRPPLRNARLFVDPYVCMMRAGHPRIGDALTRKLFLEASHALVASIGAGHRVIEETLLAQGLSQRHRAPRPAFHGGADDPRAHRPRRHGAVAGRPALREDGTLQVAEAAGEDPDRRRARALARAVRAGRGEPVAAGAAWSSCTPTGAGLLHVSAHVDAIQGVSCAVVVAFLQRSSGERFEGREGRLRATTQSIKARGFFRSF